MRRREILETADWRTTRQAVVALRAEQIPEQSP
jgi:hypothetical protein